MTERLQASRSVDEIEQARARFRGAGRAALGVTGDSKTESFRSTLRAHHLGLYPVIAVGLLLVVDQFQLRALIILGPDIADSLGVDKSTIGALILLQTLALSLAALPLAAAVQGRRLRGTVAKVTGMMWSLATAATSAVTSVWHLVGLLLFGGAASGSVTAVHESLLVDTYPPGVRARILSAYRMFAGIGAMASPLLIFLLAGPFDLDWRGVVVALGFIAVAASLFSVRLRDPGYGRFDADRVREHVRSANSQGADELAAEDTSLRFFEIVRRLMMIPTVKLVLFSHAVLGMLLVPLNTYFVFFLEERWGLDADERALFFAAVPVMAVVVIGLLSRHSEGLFRSDPARLFRLGAVMQGLGIVLLALAIWIPNFWMMFAVFGLASATFFALSPALATGYLSIVRPEMRPHASALTGIFTAGVGGFVGLALLSGLDRRYGIRGALLSVLVPGVISALVLRAASKTVNADLDRLVDELVEEQELKDLHEQGHRLPLLACRKIDFFYDRLQVLFGVDFTVDDGEMVALLGTNGAGKSTLLKAISGLGLPMRGSVRFRGNDITFIDAERRVRLGISQIPGGNTVFKSLSVMENLKAFGYTYGRARSRVDSIDDAMSLFPQLASMHSQPAGTLSGGQQQMLGLSKAFIIKPRLLLVDELSLGLAPKVVGELLEAVRRINSTGTAVVLVEQSVNLALSLVDRAYFMEKGEVRFEGGADDLLGRSDLLRSVFLEGAGRGLGRKHAGSPVA